MILHIVVTQETIAIPDLNDTMNYTVKIKIISGNAHVRLIASRYTSDEVLIDSGTAHTIFLTAHTHQVVFAMEIDVHFGVMSILAIIHP